MTSETEGLTLSHARSPETGSRWLARFLFPSMPTDAHPSTDALLPLVYDELRRLARQQRAGWHGGVTLDTTALVHESWLKLERGGRGPFSSRAHFLGVAGKAMRHILSDYARDRRRLKRGGGDAIRLPLDVLEGVDGLLALPDERLEAIDALDKALDRLGAEEPRWERVVECRFFAGLSIEETGKALGISPATVKRDWALARAWLFRALHAARE